MDFSLAIDWAHYHFFVQYIVNIYNKTHSDIAYTAQKQHYHCRTRIVQYNIFVQM